MTTVLRNTQTGEYKMLDGDSDSPEYQEITRQLRAGDGLPMWEHTGMHDYQAFLSRLDNNALRAEDIGDEGQPVTRITGMPADLDLTPSGQIDRGQATATEIAGKAGRAAGGTFQPNAQRETDGDEPVVPIGSAEGTVIDHTTVPTDTPPLVDPSLVGGGADEMESSDSRDDSGGAANDLVDENSQEELQTMAEERGLSTSGTKAQLADRIVEHDEG